jgi:N-acetylmuramoyl-L-alanine amidase
MTGPVAPRTSTLLPAIPLRTGPLRLTVMYPRRTDQVDVRDSTFLFGSTGTGDASLSINGTPIPVAPNGAWLAWLPVPADSIIEFSLEARTATDSATLVYPVRRVRRFRAPMAPVWIDSLSFAPSSRVWWPANEPLPVSVRAAEGASVRIVLSDGTSVPLTPDAAPIEVPAAIRAFDRDSGNLSTPIRADRYVGMLRGRAVGTDPGAFLGPQGPSSTGTAMSYPTATVEAVIGSDTARAAWNLRLQLLDTVPRVIDFNDDLANSGKGDSLTVGRARPGATYHWFFPTGTRTVASGRLGDDLRVRLSSGQEAWVPVADAVPLAYGHPATRGTVGSVTLTPGGRLFTLRVPMSQRVPFRVEESRNSLTLRLYNSVADINWTRFGANHPYVKDVRWLQATSDEVTLTLDFTATVWGYRTRWSGNDLLFEFRSPPVIDADHPLRGQRIVIDPGHPPLGATGPTGMTEATANLAVALRLRALLLEAGAEVLMTRENAAPVELLPRTKFADSVSAEVLVSIHNNALPDGVNPFTNNGASVFYNHPQSLPLARAVQRELVRQLGVRDLGAGRGDLALVRPTWMPSILTEGLYMMIPEQEAALASPDGQQRYAVAVRDGLAAFFRSVANGQTDVP